MATLQTILTAWKTNQQVTTISLVNGMALTGQVTDDGSAGDTFQVTHMNGKKTYAPKSQIVTIPDPTDITPATPPGQGTNPYRLL